MRQFIYFFAFQLNVYCDNQLIVGCPISFKVLADRSKVTFSSIDHCAVGMITELKVSYVSPDLFTDLFYIIIKCKSKQRKVLFLVPECLI